MTKLEFANNIPQELKQYACWINWKLEDRNGKPTKTPINPKTGGNGMSNNPDTWTGFDAAMNSWIKHKLSGIGFVFSACNDILGIDLDKCRNPETRVIETWAIEIIEKFRHKAFAEVSPSGTGIHIICRGQLPPGGRRKGKIEMYSEGRYFTVTGQVLKDYSGQIEDCTPELEHVHVKYISKQEKPQEVSISGICDIDTTSLIDRATAAMNGSKFRDLYNGGITGYPSHSEADMAFCNLLAFWCNKDARKMDAIFRQSGLFRKKWDERHGGDTYGGKTIQEAIQNCREVYTPANYIERRKSEPDNNIDKLKTYKLTDAGNSERFGDMLKGKYLYIPEQKAWYCYNGKQWEDDTNNRIVNDIIKCLRKAQKEAFNIEDDDRRTKELAWLLKSESRDKINAALSLMSSIPFMCARVSQFDKDDMLLNAQNGTVSLKTGKLQAHDRNDYITKICNVGYNPNSRSTLFETFLDEITENEQEKRKYLQKLCGYCCTAKNTEEEFYQAKGSGQNGKTKLMETIKYVLGSYAVTASPDILMAKDMSSIPNDIARLQGTRLVLMSEPDPGKRFSDNAVKSQTGGDTIIARYLHKEFFEFTMKAKMIMLTNHEIRAIGTDHGLWRRMVVIPFTYQVPEEKKDKYLQEKLIADGESVLTWMIQGCLLWQQEGLEQPQELRIVKDEYRIGQDAVGLFLDECCVEDSKAKVSATELYKAYTLWCQNAGEYEISQRVFGSRLREKGFTNVKSGTVYWFGLRFLDNLDNLDKKQINTNIKNSYKDLSEISPNRPNGPNGPETKKEWWVEAEEVTGSSDLP